jgi:parallel beta-helix repeat protein
MTQKRERGYRAGRPIALMVARPVSLIVARKHSEDVAMQVQKAVKEVFKGDCQMRRPAVSVVFLLAIALLASGVGAGAPGTDSAVAERRSNVIHILVDGSGDYATLADALATATAGTTIILGEGAFPQSASLVIRTPVRLVGAGMNLTEITSEAAECTVDVTTEGSFSAQGIAFRHQGEATADVVVIDAADVGISECLFAGAMQSQSRDAAGLRIVGRTAGVVSGCVMTANTAEGILVAGTAHVQLKQNSCTGNSVGCGMVFSERASGTAHGNICSENEQFGILITDEATPSLDSNICQGNWFAGIAYIGAASGTATGNLCTANEQHGIMVSGESAPTLESNTCEGNSWCGIAYGGSSSGVAAANQCLMNEQYGIYVSGQAAPTLDSNACQVNKWSGIAYFDSSSGSARTNQCFANEKNGIVVEEQATPTLDSNTCEKNRGSGIAYLGAASGTAIRNRCATNGQHGIGVIGDSAPTLGANTLEGNSWCGIAYYDSSSGAAAGNQCLMNEQHGVYVSEQAVPTLDSNTCQGSKWSGIAYTDSASGVAAANRCLMNEQYGIYVAEQAAPTLDSNTCQGNKWSGIAYQDDSGGTAKSNSCVANRRHGVILSERAFPTLDTNTCEENVLSGITYIGCSSGAAKGNQCLGNGKHGIYAGAHGTPTLENNTCTGNELSGIAYAGHATGTANENECFANQEDGITVAAEATPSLASNTCGENAGAGIAYYGTASGTARANQCLENGREGIYISMHAEPTLEANVCRENRSDELPVVRLSESETADGMDREPMAVLYRRGQAAYTAAQYREATTLFEQALALYRAVGDRWYEGRCLLSLGLCYQSLGEYWKAVDYIELTVSASRENGDRESEATALNALGECYQRLDDYREVIDLYERSLAIYRGLGDRPGEAKSLDHLGDCCAYLGDYQLAIARHEQALLVYRELGDRAAEAEALNGLGTCQFYLGNCERGVEYYERALAIFRAVGHGLGEAESLIGLGDCSRVLSHGASPGSAAETQRQAQSAIDFFSQALTLSRETGDRVSEARALNGLGNCLSARYGSDAKAIPYYSECLRILQELEFQGGEAASLCNLGNCYYALAVAETEDYRKAIEDFRKAAGYYERSLNVLQGLPASEEYGASDPEILWRVQSALGSCYKWFDEWTKAAESFRQAVAVIEAMRARVGTAASASLFMTKKLSIYGNLVNTLTGACSDPEQGAFYAERAKARTLVDMMETAMVWRADVLSSEVQSGSEIARRLNTLSQPAQGLSSDGAGSSSAYAPTVEARTVTSPAARRTQAEYDAFLAELEEQNPALGEMLSVSPERVQSYSQEVQKKLDEKTAVLEYFVSDWGSIVWVIGRDGIQTASRICARGDRFSISPTQLMLQVDHFLRTMQSPPSRTSDSILSCINSCMGALEAGRDLYNLLIAPVEVYLRGVTHLIIIPSDVLFYVPFAALYRCSGDTDLYHEAASLCASGSGGPQRRGEFLVERYSLSYAPSLASLYWPLQQQTPASYTSILAVGNPTGDLPYSRTEARTVAGMFGDATVLVDSQGTEAAVKSAIGERAYDVLHFSTHGLFDRQVPLASEVQFLGGGGEDGHLYAGEILGLWPPQGAVQAPSLAVLSACQTALPPDIQENLVVGDEIQGLGQSLLVAGVPSAILTLWNVTDASTSRLMIAFYKELLAGTPKGEALARAQMALLASGSDPQYRAPYYWAPFVMYGDWR